MKIHMFILAVGLAIPPAYAETLPHVRISGNITVRVPLNQSEQFSSSVYKNIQLERIYLSQAAQHYLAQSIDQKTPSLLADQFSVAKLSKKMDLGMNHVPVLDQGEHGSCVTFATTGALDATMGQGDYVSQLCQLALGAYLHERDPSYPSGWDGSKGSIVLDQIQKYGIVSKNYQATSGCGGLYQYPLHMHTTGEAMPLNEFQAHSESVSSYLSSKPLFTFEDVLFHKLSEEQLLSLAKKSISEGHRLVLGVLLDVNRGGVGAFGSYKTVGDTWMITPEIIRDAKSHVIDAGHAMVITGYDDAAMVIGPRGLTEQGVFKLRNSWSDKAGDQGDYYMTYRYFKKLALEGQQIIGRNDLAHH